MILLVTGDLHLSNNPRDAYRLAWVHNHLPAILEKTGADTLVIVGDLTQDKDGHSAELVNAVTDALCAIAKSIDIIVLLGNHDYAHPDHPFFSFLSHIEHIDFIKQPTEFQPGWLLLPHTRDPERDWPALLAKYQPEVVFCHQTFTGARGENNQQLTGVPLDLIPDGVRVYSGDVHVPQTIGPVVHIGAPYTINFGDDFVPRVLLLGTHTPTHRSIKTDDAPQKLLLTCEVTDTGDIRWSDTKPFPGDIVKVNIKLRPDQQPRWHELRAKIADVLQPTGAVIHQIKPTVDAPVRRRRVATTNTTADAELIKAYAKEHSMDAHAVQLGLELAGVSNVKAEANNPTERRQDHARSTGSASRGTR